MPSTVDIANGAMRKIGASTITSFTQGTKNANFLNDRYADTRDALLEMHQWNFAIKRVKLSKLAAAPAIKFEGQFALPSDYIRAVTVHDNDEGTGIPDHKIEGSMVLCSSNEVWLVYVSRVTDPNTMSSLFREALSALIAVEAATAIAESNTMADLKQDQFEKILRRARSADAMADLPDRMPVGSWMTHRSGRLAERKWSW